MKTKAEIVASIKNKLENKLTNIITNFVDELVDAVDADAHDEYSETISKAGLGRRKKYAETEEVMSETGMSLEEIRLWNAYSDGYNARGEALKVRLKGIEPVPEPEEEVVVPVVTPEVLDIPQPEPVVIPEPTPEPTPEPVPVEPAP